VSVGCRKRSWWWKKEYLVDGWGGVVEKGVSERGETSYLDFLTTRHSSDLSETEEWLSMVVRECNPTGIMQYLGTIWKVMQSIH
jgi:hypothetical protein